MADILGFERLALAVLHEERLTKEIDDFYLHLIPTHRIRIIHTQQLKVFHATPDFIPLIVPQLVHVLCIIGFQML